MFVIRKFLFQHVEVTAPTPKEDEVLLKVEAASLNPINWKIQEGKLRPFFPPRFPWIPGTDILFHRHFYTLKICSVLKDLSKTKRCLLVLINQRKLCSLFHTFRYAEAVLFWNR